MFNKNMKKFEYKALNNKQIELTGQIHAETLQEAEKQLTNLGYQIIELKNHTLNLNQKGLNEFKFEGYQNLKKIDGNITAKSFNAALLELIEKYSIQVEKLAIINASQQEYDESKIKINNFLKRLDFHSNKTETKKVSNLEEIYIFIDSLTTDFQHYFTDEGLQILKDLQKQYIQIQNSTNQSQKKRILKTIFKSLLSDSNYKKVASKSGLKYIFSETLSIFEKISSTNAFSLNLDKLQILLSTGSQIIRESIFQEFTVLESSLFTKINFSELNKDIKSIGDVGTIIFFSAIFLVNLKIINIQIPKLWYKVGILFFSVYSTYNFNNLLKKLHYRFYIIGIINLINLLLLIKI